MLKKKKRQALPLQIRALKQIWKLLQKKQQLLPIQLLFQTLIMIQHLRVKVVMIFGTFYKVLHKSSYSITELVSVDTIVNIVVIWILLFPYEYDKLFDWTQVPIQNL